MIFGIWTFIFVKEIYCGDDEIKYLLFNYNSNNENLIETTITLNSEIYTLPIDISSEITWINKTYNINPKREKPSIEKFCFIFDYNEKKNDFIFNNGNIRINPIYYYEIDYLNNENCPYKGILGFRDLNPDYSILNSFRKTFKMNSTFSLTKLDNNLIEMKIGNHLNYIVNNEEKIIKCDLIYDEKRMSVLQGIIIGNLDNEKKRYNVNYITSSDKRLHIINKNITFESIQKYIFARKQFIDFLKNNLFDSSIKNNICKYEKRTNFFGFFCSNQIINNFPNISFIISDSLIQFTSNELFEKIDENNYFFIIVNNENDNNKIWRFGHILLNKFNNIIFDPLTIYLVGNDIVEKIRIIEPFDPYEESKNNLKYLITFCIFIIMNLTGIITLLISLFKEKILVIPKI